MCKIFEESPLISLPNQHSVKYIREMRNHHRIVFKYNAALSEKKTPSYLMLIKKFIYSFVISVLMLYKKKSIKSTIHNWKQSERDLKNLVLISLSLFSWRLQTSSQSVYLIIIYLLYIMILKLMMMMMVFGICKEVHVPRFA